MNETELKLKQIAEIMSKVKPGETLDKKKIQQLEALVDPAELEACEGCS